MALSEPAFTFTIPSIHDDTPLDCRVYHPTVLFEAPAANWLKKGAVVAHPYAPLGGSYDDHVVAMVADELLRDGFVVGTFNFRGAHSSKGRTSWTGKPELDDYISFAGFLIHYVDLLHSIASPTTSTPTTPSTSTLSISDPHIAIPASKKEKSLILLAGYSYGSLITKHLPPTSNVLSLFSNPVAGSAASEILLRAQNLSSQTNHDLQDAASRRTHMKKPGHEHAIKMGGEETPSDLRRSSREIRRSLDLPRAVHSLSLRRKRNELAVIQSRVDGPPSPAPSSLAEDSNAPAISTAYLLISTIPPPLSTLMIPAIGHKFWNAPKAHDVEPIVRQPTLAVFGDRDGFAAVKKYKSWAAKLKAEPQSRFEWQEVAGAGHFWHEDGAEGRLRGAIRGWVRGLRWE